MENTHLLLLLATSRALSQHHTTMVDPFSNTWSNPRHQANQFSAIVLKFVNVIVCTLFYHLGFLIEKILLDPVLKLLGFRFE